MAEAERTGGFGVKGSVAVSFACLVFLAIAAVLLGYTGRDDSHITYFVSEALAAGQGIVNFNGEPVEQSSTLAFTAVLGAITALTGISAASLGPFVSFIFLGLSVGVAVAIVRAAGFSPLAILSVVSVPAVYWSLSGMEGSFYLFLFLSLGLWILRAAQEQGKSSGAVLFLGLIAATSALLAITRPEFILVIALSVAVFTGLGGARLRQHAGLSGVILAGAATGIGFRLLIGLDLFPNTVYAKAGDPSLVDNARIGFLYLLVTFTQVPLSVIFAIGGCVAGAVYARSIPACAEKTVITFALAVTLSILAFAVATGGDWMEVGRFVVVPMVFATLAGLAPVRSRLAPVIGALFLVAMLFDTYRIAGLNFGGLPFFQRHPDQTVHFDPSPIEGSNVIHARDLSFIDRALPVLKEAAGPEGRVVVASQQAGMVPYYLRREMGERFYFVDLLGLATDHVHGCRGRDGWAFDPYDDIPAVEACVGLKFDFLFDLGKEGWPRLRYMEGLGCREVFRESVEIQNVPAWKNKHVIPQFLVECR